MVYGPAGGTVDFDEPTFVQTTSRIQAARDLHLNAAGLAMVKKMPTI
jgi:hypothetical protein